MNFLNVYKYAEENTRLAMLSLWAPGSHMMRQALEKMFSKEPLLAEPVFQSNFGWEQTTDETWRKFISADAFQRIEQFRMEEARRQNHEFRPFHPYRHQAQSWQALHENKSLVVTSGTGSGKTECFFYPVMSDLYEQMQQANANNAIQALFLYPLNALMNDQKKRLNDFCQALSPQLRFAVYNGETKESHEDGQNPGLSNEVTTRDAIRDSETRPQILLTNPSMLEYILVRHKDQQFLQESAGKLRWIIIDEAHSYSGSAAVELSLLIKRVLEAFHVSVEQVRFVCTSATFGGDDGEEFLKSFISTLIGKRSDDIRIVGGERAIPPLNEQDVAQTINHLEVADISAQAILNLRKQINAVPGMSLNEIWNSLVHNTIAFDRDKALGLIDKLCEWQINGLPVLSLRAHFFMRTVNGLYACCNPDCKGSSGTSFGHVTSYQSQYCPECGAPLIEIVQCKKCKSFLLMGEEDNRTLHACDDVVLDMDYFALESDSDEEGQADDNDNSNKLFLLSHPNEYINPLPVNQGRMRSIDIHLRDHVSVLQPRPQMAGRWIQLVHTNEHGRQRSSRCPCCGNHAFRAGKVNFKPFRMPMSFINQCIAPVILRESTDGTRYWGKYISFTDSRQGTAISAKLFNINTERTYAREKLVEKLATRGDSMSLDRCKNVIWHESIYRHFGDENIDHRQGYKAALLRNLIGRKPLYEQSLESLGLITLRYLGIEHINAIPNPLIERPEWAARIGLQDWRDFLKLIIDYYVRMGNHIQPYTEGEEEYIREGNKGIPLGNNEWIHVQRDNQRQARPKQNRLVVLLCAGLGIYTLNELKRNAQTIDAILQEAKSQLIESNTLRIIHEDEVGHNGITEDYVGGYYLDLSGDDDDDGVTEVARTVTVEVCPISNQLLDTTFCHYSPLIDIQFQENAEQARRLFNRYLCTEKLNMPQRPANNDDVTNWMHQCPEVIEMKKRGIWNDRYNECYRLNPPYLAAEHSAQQGNNRLQQYVDDFREGRNHLYVLHCSTTMEMGVNIEEINTVLMATIPPSSANYLQRAGRAGRRGQTKSLAFCLCNNTPIGQSVFANPMCALSSPVKVAPLLKSGTILQRHINSYFFRRVICGYGEGIPITQTVSEFMDGSYTHFIRILERFDGDLAQDEREHFSDVFGEDTSYSAIPTKDAIVSIHDDYRQILQRLQDAAVQQLGGGGEHNRINAILSQIGRLRQQNLLMYLTEKQFFPNASMPIGVVSFNYMDRNSMTKINRLRREREEIVEIDPRNRTPEAQRRLNSINQEMERIWSNTSTERDVRTALNEYAPGQTIVVDERNYLSSGISFEGTFDDTRIKFIYHCPQCGYVEYSDIGDEHRLCPNCQEHFHGIVNRNVPGYTRAYSPVGFRTCESDRINRRERTEKNYYQIKPILLRNAETEIHIPMCRLMSSEHGGKIIYYNIGRGYGFAMCKFCGRAAVEYSMNGQHNTIPFQNRQDGNAQGHTALWGGACHANHNDIARNVVFTGVHPTCYTTFQFRDEHDISLNDEQLAYSLGVVLTRALAHYVGIDESEVDFGVKQENQQGQTFSLLYIYDTAKGGCGYSLYFTKPGVCSEIFQIALTMLESAACSCEESEGACFACLIDRNSTRFANKLSKRKAKEWLENQARMINQLPQQVIDLNTNAIILHRKIRDVLRAAIADEEIEEMQLFVSDISGDVAISDWVSSRIEIGRLIHQLVERNKRVCINIEYHPNQHDSVVSKYPFIGLAEKFPDYNICFIGDMGALKTLLVQRYRNGRIRRLFTDQQDTHSFSDSWGITCNRLFVDESDVNYTVIPAPAIDLNPLRVVREGKPDIQSFQIKNYFTQVIAPCTLHLEDIQLLRDILTDQHVDIEFNDAYANSALAGLMLTYLIKDLKNLFHFTIGTMGLRLRSPRRSCTNDRFNGFTRIHYNFRDENEADEYIYNLLIREFEVEAAFLPNPTDHCRWLQLRSENGGVVDIRFDHGVSGGWISREMYNRLDNLNGDVFVSKYESTEHVYYIIMQRPNNL